MSEDAEVTVAWKDEISRTCGIVEGLVKRIDSHSREYSDNFGLLFKKVDELKDKIHAVELNSIREDGNIKGKIIAIMAGISTVIYIIGDSIKAAIHFQNK